MKLSEQQALHRIAAYCSKAERCELDVKRKLEKWELAPITINSIIVRLRNENFLNDGRFTKAFIKDKIEFNKWGKIKISYELRKKNIPEFLIDTCFSELESNIFETPLSRILSNKLKSVKANNEYEKRIKLTRFALGRGYSYEEVQKCLSKLLNSEGDEYLEPFN